LVNTIVKELIEIEKSVENIYNETESDSLMSPEIINLLLEELTQKILSIEKNNLDKLEHEFVFKKEKIERDIKSKTKKNLLEIQKQILINKQILLTQVFDKIINLN